MNLPQDVNREYAYFRATGGDDPVEITRALDIEPTAIWKVGEPFERRGRQFRRRSSQWRLDSELTDEQPLSDHVDALLCRLEPKRDSLWSIREKFLTQFVCVGFFFQSFSWELDFDLQRRATALGIGFWFDFYPTGDQHEGIEPDLH